MDQHFVRLETSTALLYYLCTPFSSEGAGSRIRSSDPAQANTSSTPARSLFYLLYIICFTKRLVGFFGAATLRNTSGFECTKKQIGHLVVV